MSKYLLFRFISIIFTLLFADNLKAQKADLAGKISASNQVVPAATISLNKINKKVVADSSGFYTIPNVPYGTYLLQVEAVGFRDMQKTVTLSNSNLLTLDFQLSEIISLMDEIVVTGTRTPKRRTNSPVIVNLINSKTLDQVLATNLSEGLKYQPGLRVETDCQTCNYTQLRINGLQGGYSQILINSRPIFSPLTGLYGMEQIPVNMIERIEVVRGGVSALYGSSAIGGTVNVITKLPTANSFNITNTFQIVKGSAVDNVIAGNVILKTEDNKVGVSLFVNNRNREAYDANGDNFSELPKLKDNSFGANFFFKPKEYQKLEISLSSIYEYRYGGEMVNKPAYLAQQSEERTHNILMGSVDYSINFNENKNSLSFYYGGQNTKRNHYTGIIPDDSLEMVKFYQDPPYGTSNVTTHQGGLQFNHKINNFFKGSATLTTGLEYVFDDVFDEIEPYNYLIDQTTKNFGAFVQNDWDITRSINFLTGFRLDKHNLVAKTVFSPRLSLLYKLKNNIQLRAGWGTGFRAPQAFDADLHIAFAGGGVSRISLADNLKEERSNSFTGSVNYDKATEYFIAGFTLEGFYTKLNDAFIQFPLGPDALGERFEKRNGSGALVKGLTLETRANFDYIFQVDAGFTVQQSNFKDAVENIDGLEAKKEFLRTPDNYGYATFSYTPTKKWSVNANLVYTGSMQLAHLAGENTGQTIDQYLKSKAFTDAGIRVGRLFNFNNLKTGLEIFAGVKNIFDAYQTDFDKGKNRDSNFIYGPALPRTYLMGIRLKSL